MIKRVGKIPLLKGHDHHDNHLVTKQLDLFAPIEDAPSETRDAKTWRPEWDRLPDVRDGLTREQRVILYTLYEAEKEMPDRSIPTLMLYGRVCERIPMPKERFKALLANLVGRGVPEL